MAHESFIRRVAWLNGVIGLALAALSACSVPDLGIPNTGGLLGQAAVPPGKWGQAFVASAMDQNGCPSDQATHFIANQPVYVGYATSEIPQGVTIFVRLTHNGQPLVDTREITAGRNLTTCVWFVFRPDKPSEGLQSGNYQADLYVNDNTTSTVTFAVQNSGPGSMAVSGGGFFGPENRNASGVQLSNLITTDRVDDQGCPGDAIVQFRSDQPVYAAYDPFLLPAGSQMYALLLRNDHLVETTKTINAQSDLNSCIWFKFDAGSKGGLQPGVYTLQIFINGSQADSVQFSVR